MTLKELCKISHKQAIEKGFWVKCNNCKGEGSVIIENHNCDCPVCDGSGKEHRNFSELLMLIVSELGECQEALRKGHRQIHGLDGNEVTSCGDLIDITRHINHGKWGKDTVEDELADAVIRIADLCEAEGIDLEWQIKQKLAYNKTRPVRHGKKF